MKKELLLTILMVLGIMAAPVKVMGQTTNLLPSSYYNDGFFSYPLVSEGNKGVKYHFYSGDRGALGGIYSCLLLQGELGKYTVTKAWEKTSSETTSYDIEALSHMVDMTYYTGQNYMIAEIEAEAFSNFTSLASVALPKRTYGVTIGDYAFNGCEKLTLADNLHYVYKVGEGAFKDTPLNNNSRSGEFNIGSSCSNMTEAAGEIGDYAFQNTSPKRVSIGNYIQTIGEGAFDGCSSMGVLVIGDNVNNIKRSAFSGCTGLTHIYLGKSLRFGINFSQVFDAQMNLDKISIPDENTNYSDEGNCLVDIADRLWIGTNSSAIPNRVTAIRDYAFYGRKGLTSIVIPAGVTKIGEEAFAYCENLNLVVCMGENPPSYTETTFAAIPYDAVLLVPTEEAAEAYNSEGWGDYFGSIKVGTIGQDANGISWALYTNDSGYTLMFSGIGAMSDYANKDAVPWSKNNVGDKFDKINKVIVKEGITHIGESCLAYLGFDLGMDGAIKVDVSLPDGLESVAADAFMKSYGLKSIKIPQGLSTIGNRAFYDCHNLAAITADESNETYRAEGNCLLKDIDGIYGDDEMVVLGCYNSRIPEGVRYIGGNAFAGQKRLKSITIPSSVEEIYGYGEELGAFSNSALESITFAEGSQLTTIDSYAFCFCDALKSIDLPNSLTTIGEGAFQECSALESVTLGSSVETIGASAFICAPISSITIPASVTSIGKWAFYDCGLEHVTLHCANVDNWFSTYATIKEVVVGEGVENIVDDAFSGCSIESVTFNCANVGDWFSETATLKEVVLSENVTSIGNKAFYNCDALESIAIPNSVTSIGESAFEMCYSLVSATLSNSMETIPNSMFYECIGLKNVTIPESITTIGNEAFSDCYALESITLPNSVTTVGDNVFSYCDDLESVTLSNAMETIPDSMFIHCSGLKNITIPESVTSIGKYAFYSCTALTEITIPNSVTSIGAQAFQRCNNIMTVTIGKSVKSIGASAFLYINNSATVTWLPYNMPTLGARAFNPESINNITWRVYYIPNYSSMSDYFTIEAIPVTITDGAVEKYEDFFEEDILLSRMEYNRTLLADSKWNALYVPFEIPVADIIDKYDVAYINDVRLYDSDNDGEIDDNGMEVEVVPVKSGTLNANTPCLIRVKKSLSTEDAAAARSMNLALETKLCPAEEKTFDCSSIYKTFAFTGVYNKRVMDVDEDFTGAFAIATDGNWRASKSLKPFRIFLQITNRDGSPYQPTDASASIRIRVAGEDEEATGISSPEAATDNAEQVIYDLHGRRVKNPTKGIYIVNGKKTVIK